MTVTGRVHFQPTAAEQDEIRACLQKPRASRRSRQGGAGSGRRRPDGGGWRLGGGGGRRRAAAGSAASTAAPSPSACRPGSATSARTITTPQQTLQQIVNPPQTNIKSSSYTIAGVDPSQPGDRRS